MSRVESSMSRVEGNVKGNIFKKNFRFWIKKIVRGQVFVEGSLRASSPIWASPSEKSLARTRKRAAFSRGSLRLPK